jgi:hypothetical protein
MNKAVSQFINRNTKPLLIGSAAIIGFIATLFYWSVGLNIVYNDAASHLNISRRIIDNLHPGLVQLGSTWLPLLHILELPFIWNHFLWQSGLAGSAVSGISFTVSCYFLFKLLIEITSNKNAAIVGVVAFVANANILYLQSAAMFEPLLMATSLGSIYYLYKWVSSDNPSYLVISAIWILLATLTRYDGWSILLASIFVIGYTLIYKRKLRQADGVFSLYISLAGLGVAVWLLYNLLIFGNPLYFANNEFSAHAQQLVLAKSNELPTFQNLVLSARIYLTSAMLNIGVLVSVASLVGLALYIKKNRFKPTTFAALLVLAPLPFNIEALFKGQSVLWIPGLPPFQSSYFNVRYGILLLPAAILFIGYLASINKWARYSVYAIIVLQLGLFYSVYPGAKTHLNFAILRDSYAGIDASTTQAATWLGNNYTDGRILISSAKADATIFRTGIDLKNFITEGTGGYWYNSLKEPEKYAEWVVLLPSYDDGVGKQLKSNKTLADNYSVAFENQTYVVLKRSKMPSGLTQSATYTYTAIFENEKGQALINAGVVVDGQKTNTDSNGKATLVLSPGLQFVEVAERDGQKSYVHLLGAGGHSYSNTVHTYYLVTKASDPIIPDDYLLMQNLEMIPK